MGQVMANTAVQLALARIRTAIGVELGNLEGDQGAVFQLALNHVRSPIEAVVTMATTEQGPQPAGLITATLDLTTRDDLNALLTRVATAVTDIQLVAPIGPDGTGVVGLGGLPVTVHFDESSRLLSLVVSPEIGRAHV